MKKLIADINEKDNAQKESQAWLKEAYGGLKIRRMDNIPPAEYATYGRFLDSQDRRVYVVVHPAFYAFFMNNRVLSSESDRDVLPSKNIVERLYEQREVSSVFDRSFDLMQEQEMALRDFLETMSAEKKLVIVILPKDYREHLSYGYVKGLDEYTRYINEITNMSESVLYTESVSYDVGALSEDSAKMLALFFKDVDAKSVLVGGGFAGRCQEAFIGSLTKEVAPGMLYVMPEVSAISADDLAGGEADNLLTKKGKLNFREIARNIKYGGEDSSLKSSAKMKRLYIYELEGSRLRLLNGQRKHVRKKS
ncbi:MAG: hypothetical protein M0Z60_00115 [Nitrospiraceae bacterium]|nr:hypothetical protein [Nitrospiraceae bacterium]